MLAHAIAETRVWEFFLDPDLIAANDRPRTAANDGFYGDPATFVYENTVGELFWTRYYEYAEDGNRLLANSTTGDDPEGPYSHEYDHDAHGNMISMPHLSSMIWNHDDEMQEVAVGSETVYFQYAGGNRTRKFVEKSGTITEERIYLGAFEIFRKRISGDIDVERESLHISDGTGRILLIETLTIDEGDAVGSPVGMWRYQLSNHIGSASTEINEDGDIISHEEYHPYGTSAYRAVDSSVDVSARRYRYSGMERDDETGLGYHTARYYASWLGRWTASDPIGLAGGGNRFEYCGGSPIGRVDLNGNGPFLGDFRSRYAPVDTGGGDAAELSGAASAEPADPGPEQYRAAAIDGANKRAAARSPEELLRGNPLSSEQVAEQRARMEFRELNPRRPEATMSAGGKTSFGELVNIQGANTAGADIPLQFAATTIGGPAAVVIEGTEVVAAAASVAADPRSLNAWMVAGVVAAGVVAPRLVRTDPKQPMPDDVRADVPTEPRLPRSAPQVEMAPNLPGAGEVGPTWAPPEYFLQRAMGKQGFDAPPADLKQKFSEGGYTYEVRIHAADAQYGKTGSIYRVRRHKDAVETDPKLQGSGWEFIDDAGNWHHQSTLWEGAPGSPNPNFNEEAARRTHMQLQR